MEGMYNPGIYAKEVPNNDMKEALNAVYGRSMFPPMCFCSDLGKPIGGFVSHPSYESPLNAKYGSRLIPERILKSGSATIVFWKDGTKTVVKCAKDDRLSGNPNQMNIQSMYSDIDTDANDTESEAQATMDDVLWFINCHLANTGQGNFEGEEVDIIFNRDMLMNESDIIDNCQKSQGIISDETIISMHPWVDDPQLEMERLKKQKEEAQKEMLAQYDPFSTQNQNGDGADDDPDNKGDPSQGSQGGEVDE